MRYFQWVILLIFALLVQGCAPSTALVTEATQTPVPAATQTSAPTSTPTPLPSPTFTASPTVVIPPPTSTIIIPTLAPPTAAPLPQAQVVVGLSVGKTVTFTSCAGTNPVEFNGTITTNTSATIQYDWLLRGKATYNSPSQKTYFRYAGTKTVFSATSYNAACGKYTVSLHIIQPDHLLITKLFSVP